MMCVFCKDAGGTDTGIFVTTSGFTETAVEEAAKNTSPKIALADGRKLTELMIQYGLGVSTVKTYGVRRLDLDYFSDETE